MKATGFVKKVDKVGRVNIPRAVRENLSIAIGDEVEISAHVDYIIIEKYRAFCHICNIDKNIKHFKGIPICQNCIDELIKKI